MNCDIVFLHTAEVHKKTFGELGLELDPEIKYHHIVHEELLDNARKHGISKEVEIEIANAMQSVSQNTGAKIVVCTCSTIGGVAESTELVTGAKSMRIDRAMADKAVVEANNILILAALESTLKPTEELVQDSKRRLSESARIELMSVEGAWEYFEAGEIDRYHQKIASFIELHWSQYDVIMLAQASMAKATEYCQNVGVPILSSPRLGVESAISEFKKT